MAIQYNVDNVVSDFKKRGNKTNFEPSLRQVLEWSKNNSKIASISDLAYLLATASTESDYSLQRWESDYLCGEIGYPYKDKPCQKALEYYRSSKGRKKNYYDLGTDSRGLPYFGRGLINLTGKEVYKSLGDVIGVDLVSNPDLALEPRNSYEIAVAFMNIKRGGIYAKDGKSRSPFEMAKDGDLTLARKSVNGGSIGLEKANKMYKEWLSILNNNATKGSAIKTKIKDSRKFAKALIIIGIGLIAVSSYLYFRKKK